MSNQQPKQPNNLSDSLYEQNHQLHDEERLLDTTRQKNIHQNINSQSKPSQFQLSHKNTLTKDQEPDNHVYVKKQHLKISNDVEDLNDLETQIQRLKKIKNQYKEQQQSIKKLTKAVQTLKSQNKSLKLQHQSNREEDSDHKYLNEIEQNYQSNFKLPGKKIHTQNAHNIIKGNIANRNFQPKNINLSSEGMERFLSPQSHRRISSNSLRNIQISHLNHQENYLNDMIRIDQEIIIKNHQNNKKSVITNFVEELKHELEQNQIILQRQKKTHRETKQKLQVCLQELADLRSLIYSQKNTDFLERENIHLRTQLEIEIEQRLLAEEKLRQKQLILSQYESGFNTRYPEFDRELDKMDEIYFSIERTLKL